MISSSDNNNSFFVTTGVNGLNTTSQTPVFLFTNPSGSGKTVEFSFFSLGTPEVAAATWTTYLFYLNPTISSNGTALAVTGARQSYQNAPISKAYLNPTISSYGTLFFAATTAGSANDLVVPFDDIFYLDPGNSILITLEGIIPSLGGDYYSVCAAFTEE